MNTKKIESIVRKHFQHVNKEGVGFLESNIIACIAELTKHNNILTIGTEVTIKNEPADFAGNAGKKKKITKHVKFRDEMGYGLNGKGIFLNEDFEPQN